MRYSLVILALCVVVGCSPEIPDSGAGVGFGDYGTFMRDRDRQAVRPASIVPPPQVVSLPPRNTGQVAQPFAPVQMAPVQTAILQSGPIGQGSRPLPPVTIPQPQTTAPGPVTTQDFQAIASGGAGFGTTSFPAPAQGTVEMVAPSALPTRPADMPNIIEYALNARNGVGEKVWRRSPLTMQNTDRNCRSFVNSDLAQEEFLRRGGPARDQQNLDPDGDGFACWWDPAPFRAAAARAVN
jgi:hypothetical protein